MEEVFVPVLDAPIRGGCRREARHCQRGCKHVFAEARIRIFGIERVYQQGVAWLNWRMRVVGREGWCDLHLAWYPWVPKATLKRFIECNHVLYFAI